MMSKLPAPGAPSGYYAASANCGSVSRSEGNRIVLHLPHCNHATHARYRKGLSAIQVEMTLDHVKSRDRRDPHPALLNDRLHLSQLLEEEGYHVVSAANGKDGLAQLVKEHPDMVLTDFMMPVADGLEMVRECTPCLSFNPCPWS